MIFFACFAFTKKTTEKKSTKIKTNWDLCNCTIVSIVRDFQCCDDYSKHTKWINVDRIQLKTTIKGNTESERVRE